MKKELSPKKLPALLPGVTCLWWEVGSFSAGIQPLQVVKETPKTLLVAYEWNGRASTRTMLKTRSNFSTWEKAHAAWTASVQKGIESLEERIVREKALLEIIKTLKEPAP